MGPDDFSNIVCIYKTLIKGLENQQNFEEKASSEILAKITLSLANLACDANTEEKFFYLSGFND